ncbi:unnamed protein product [Rotaria sordida]|uniref:Uncharacterized protein n=1 Tax=Rotaria sordida TaxID=392033 RepID=A0A814GLS7_9BILA|nr:unnamed protein product [Rotaria sordida]CAF0998005.1 unnamed protein product [Rotaria sordida]CAF1278761.1 unnamed protein product [Rotaria sordida]
MMSVEEEMEYQSYPSASVDAPMSSARHRSVARRHGCSLNSIHFQSLNLTSKHLTSTPKPIRPSGRSSNQSSTNNQSSIRTKEKKGNLAISLVSSIPSSNSPGRFQSPVSPLPLTAHRMMNNIKGITCVLQLDLVK